MSADPGLRVIHKHFPILGPDSVIAARAALAARGQGRYGAYHDALMQSRSAYTEERVIATATAVGLDGTRLKAEMNDEILLGVLRENIALAQALGIRGTPTYVIGETLFFGVPEAATLRRLVAEARKKG
jgi:protein-disulfide isomerase